LLLESPDRVSECLNRFVPEKFEELFTKFAKTEKSRLSFNELLAMTEANRNAVDPFGW
jgi:peroxygenase